MHPLRPIEDFVEPLRALVEEGIPFAVIGGIAVGCYARLLGLTVLSADLDICVTEGGMPDVLDLARREGATIISRPQPRGLPVAFIDWHGRELNVLTRAQGLPEAHAVIEAMREVELSAHHVVVPIADPFDILANKLAIRRPKDLPHIEILERFTEEEVVATMRAPGPPRRRIDPARHWIDLHGTHALPEQLGERLVALADALPIRRFLVGRLATQAQAERVIAAAPIEEREQLADILAKRSFTQGP